ncbi:MAG: DUF927 domain-containing protein [Thioalkalivibrio sp.]
MPVKTANPLDRLAERRERRLEAEPPPAHVNEPIPLPTAAPEEPEIKRPCFKCYKEWFALRGQKMRPGLYLHEAGKGEDATPTDKWICSPIDALAQTADEYDSSHGLLLKFMTPGGRWKEWAAPLHMLKGSGEELRGELLDQGVRIDPTNRSLLTRWLMNQYPKTKVTAATRTGWHDADDGVAFVMPTRTIGAEGIRYQSEHAHMDAFTERGSLDVWREYVATPCKGNPVLLLAVSTAFAGPLLKVAKLQEAGGAGIHLVGDSSAGKTTALQAAASVWGSPDFVRTWRATANGMEAAASGLSDSLLVLDEVSQSDPREIGAVVYALANGMGKQRAARTGGQRQTARWRLMLLSSGERTLSSHMGEAGKKSKAGHEARLLDVPATGREHGAFDTLHHHPNGRAFADELKQATAKNYGKAGPAFLQELLRDKKKDLPGLYAQYQELPRFQGRDGLESRAAGVFALIGLAGELATEYKLTPWAEGEAMDAAMDAFGAWRSARGAGSTETRQILDSLRDFIDTQGDSRFSDVGAKDEYRPIPNRAGWWREDEWLGRVYLFNGAALREACAGHDLSRILDALEESGAMPKVGAGKKRGVPVRVAGRVPRLYPVETDKLEPHDGVR